MSTRRTFDPELSALAREAIPDVDAALAGVRLYDMATTKAHNVQQRWPDEDKALLKRVADAEDRTETAVLLRAIREYAAKHGHAALSLYENSRDEED